MKKRISFIALLTNVLLALTFGTVLGNSMGVNPLFVASGILMAGTGLQFISSDIIPKGAALSGVYREIWTGELVESLKKETTAAFLGQIPDYSRYVQASANRENELIHLVDIGADPNVLINNTSYPIGYASLTEGDLNFQLDKFQTEATKVTDDELYAITYDKIGVANRKHKNAILAVKQGKAIHAIAPTEDKTDTPLQETSGDSQNGIKIATVNDIIDLAGKMTDAGVPDDGQRILVLNSKHVNHILKEVKNFYKDYANIGTGEVRALFYGFKTYVYHNMPFYLKPDGQSQTKYEKADFGDTFDSDTHAIASAAFYAPDMFRAQGSTRMYFDEPDTQNQQSALNYRHYYLVAPKKERAMAALVTQDA